MHQDAWPSTHTSAACTFLRLLEPCQAPHQPCGSHRSNTGTVDVSQVAQSLTRTLLANPILSRFLQPGTAQQSGTSPEQSILWCTVGPQRISVRPSVERCNAVPALKEVQVSEEGPLGGCMLACFLQRGSALYACCIALDPIIKLAPLGMVSSQLSKAQLLGMAR